jgi:hypothetical protein
MEQQPLQKTNVPPLSPAVLEKKTDSHSYKGWLNSDLFLKRALAVYGYGFVGNLIVMIPVFIIFSIFFGFLAAAFLGGIFGQKGDMPQMPDMNGKLNINEICEGSLAYTDFTDGAAAGQYVKDCKEGKHPEVIENYKKMMMAPNDGMMI